MIRLGNRHRNRRRLALAAATSALAVTSAGLTAGASQAAPSSAAATDFAQVAWHACPAYSDDVLATMMPPKDIPGFREQWARTQCGKVSVPLDYAKPHGRRITIAITRLPATDPGKRKGILAFNPGGPGAGGYLMPIVVTLINPENRQLNEQYDLIGFDPRGVGYSTTVKCPNPGEDLPPLGSGPATREEALRAYEQTVRNNAECAAVDPEFLGAVTTPNIARDLDRVRAALGAKKLNYFGGSWGTWLGAVYRSEFPQRTGRFWLDSVMPPQLRLDSLRADGATAAARSFDRFAAWLAERHGTYGFGTTADEVKQAVARMSASFDANPRKFTDVEHTLDGYAIGDLASLPAFTWPQTAKVLQELRDATGPEAPPAVKEHFGPPPPPPPPGAPRQFSPTMAQAAFCNEDVGARDFASWWAAYQDRLAKYPVTGRTSGYTPPCAGWPLPARQPRLKANNAGTLVLSGHRDEIVTPYEWTWQMHAAVGGAVNTIADDRHGTALETPGCAGKVREFFATGRVPRYCAGEPEPTGPQL